MADEVAAGEEQELPEDDAGERAEREYEVLGVDRSVFLGLLDDALDHAADPARADGAAVHWVSMGPRNVGGRIRALAAHPTHPGTLYAGSAFGGLWRTTDAGDTWTPLDRFQPPAPPNDVRQALPIGAIAVDPRDPSRIYAGTGEPSVKPRTNPERHYPGNGFYRSTDGGSTFERLDHPETGTIKARRYERIVVDPWLADHYWVASTTGLWRHEPGTGFITPADSAEDVTDVAIDFGDLTRAAPATFTVSIAVRGKGVFRRVFERATATYQGAGWEERNQGLPKKDFHRVKIALCRSRPAVLYAAMAQDDHSASRVFRTRDGGSRWEETGRRPGDDDNRQAYYNLVVEVHPENPDIAFFGTVDLFRTLNGGESWTKVLDWERYSKGDRAQHGDQHALLFDPVDPRRIWVANDGGISMSPNLGGSWRKRSHGILAAQFYDLAVHPKHPFVQGGGLHDNGTWVSFGGQSWIRVAGGDGGAMGFDPDDTQRMLATVQGKSGSRTGVYRVRLANTTDADQLFLTRLPDLLPATVPPTLLRSRRIDLEDGFEEEHISLLPAILEHHPTDGDHALVGRKRAGYVTTDGSTFTRLGTGDFTPASAEVSTLAYGAVAPDDVWWLATSKGELFFTGDHGTNWAARTPPGIGAKWISRVAVHPANDDIVAVAVAGSPGRVFLSGDRGVTWWDISGNPAAAPVGGGPYPADSLGPAPPVSLVFDPRSPAGLAADQTLYAGTLAGVYVIRNARTPAGTPPPAVMPGPVWRTLNPDLPLLLIYDLASVVEENAAGVVVRQSLRAATHGRGVWERDLAGGLEIRLFIRDTVVDDGLPHEGDAALTDDPRLVPALPLDRLQAYDIRVDAPPFSFFEEVMDPVEFDEDLIPDKPLAGERNRVYVQVHNGGWGLALDVEVHLFWAEVPAGGPPPPIPNLPAGFFASLAAPPAVGDWERVAPAVPVSLLPGAPRVVAFDWTPPVTLTTRAALLALATHPADPIAGGSLVVADLVRDDRQAAVRVVEVEPFVPDVFIRDGIDDDGRAGSVSWGGRSPDIIVVQAEVDPRVEFPDLGDHHSLDKVRAGVANHAYIRLHNRTNIQLDAAVELFHAPLATLHDHSTWTSLGSSIPVPVLPRHWAFSPVITWTPAAADPDLAQQQAYALVAAVVLAGDTAPGLAGMADLAGLWNTLLAERHGSQVRANNVALRVLPFEA